VVVLALSVLHRKRKQNRSSRRLGDVLRKEKNRGRARNFNEEEYPAARSVRGTTYWN